jgi:hypothetical protein
MRTPNELIENFQALASSFELNAGGHRASRKIFSALSYRMATCRASTANCVICAAVVDDDRCNPFAALASGAYQELTRASGVDQDGKSVANMNQERAGFVPWEPHECES